MSRNIILTLMNGFELMGRVVEEQPGYYIIQEPLGIQTQQTGPETYGLVFVPFSAVNPEGKHKIYTHSIASESVEVPDEMDKAYIKRTSKIQIVGSI